jgi:hypothetical protein
VVQAVGADLDARHGEVLYLGRGQQSLAWTTSLPAVVPTEQASHHEDRRGEAGPDEHRHDMVDEVLVPVVKGEPDQPLGAPDALRIEQLAHRRPPQAVFGQPAHLLGEAHGVHGDEERVLLVGSDRVVHQDQRKSVGSSAHRKSFGLTAPPITSPRCRHMTLLGAARAVLPHLGHSRYAIWQG